MIAALLAFGVIVVAWLAYEVWRAPLVCYRCEAPLPHCYCERLRHGR